MKYRVQRALLPDGVHRNQCIEMGSDGRIVSVEAARGDEPLMPGLLLPGMPNLHSHAFQRAMAGSAEVMAGAEHSFWGWRAVMYRFLEQLTPEDVSAIAAFAYLEMLEAGYTSVAEFHYLHHTLSGAPYKEPAAMADAVRAGAARVGMRHLLLPTLYQQGGFQGEPLSGAQRRFYHDTDAFLRFYEQLRLRATGLQTTGIALHSLRAVPKEALLAVTNSVDGAGDACVVHIHVAEQAREVSDSVAATGRRPVEWLLETGRVSERWCLVHATHVSATEIRDMAASGAVVGLCPTTEGNLGDGRFPLDSLLQEGGRFGIGSDSHVSLDPREELRSLEYTLRLWRERRVISANAAIPHCGTYLYTQALAGGAQAMGESSHGLVVGAVADMVLLDTDRAEFTGLTDDALLDAWLFAPRPQAVSAVWVAGRAVVQGGRHVAYAEVAASYRAALKRLAKA